MQRRGIHQRVAAWMFANATDPPEYREPMTRLLGGLTGDVLELGPGTGRNLRDYRPDVHWTGLEPNEFLHDHIERTAREHTREITVVAGVGEAIPLPDASVDAVVATLVLCSVTDQVTVLREVRRVLRPGGRFVFLEHVAAATGTSRRCRQRWFRPVCRHVADGCQPDRETLSAIQAAGFASVTHDEFEVATPFGVLDPHIVGFAVR
ncbi:MAG TPA: class I SAM-dependent methyltransferase [Thermomicrobiales bacterium]|jgi:ubiquinone/menaquinone biosynthesis C-methylase UbiE|nr:class I SAM-dependent methyltransferase [Thermomicrobiales bacterium]